MASEEHVRLWVRGKLERQSAHELVKCVASILEDVLSLPLSTWLLPSWAKIRPLMPGEVRVQLPSGEWAVSHPEKPPFVQFPLFALRHHWATLTATVDRSSINSSAIYFLRHLGYVISPHWDFCHGQTGAIKEAAKATGSTFLVPGKPQWMHNTMVEWLIPANLNRGPFGSGAWYMVKQEFLQQWLDSHSVHSVEFQLIVHELGRSMELPTATLCEQQYVYDRMGAMASFNERGVQCKLSRWYSINDSWKWLEPEVVGLRTVLRWATNSDAGEGSSELVLGTAYSHAELIQDTKRKTGSWALAPHCLRNENLDNMRLYAITTSACWSEWGFRVEHITTPVGSKLYYIELAGGAWQREVVDVVRRSFATPANLRYMRIAEDATGLLLRKLVELALLLVRNRIAAMMAYSDSYPERSVRGLHADVTVRDAWLRSCNADWSILQRSEALALTSRAMTTVLESIHWRNASDVRLFFTSMNCLLADNHVWTSCTLYIASFPTRS